MGNIRTALEYLKSILKMTNNGTDLSAQSEGDLKMAIQILEEELEKLKQTKPETVGDKFIRGFMGWGRGGDQ